MKDGFVDSGSSPPTLDEYQISPADLFDTLQPGDRFTARFCSTRSTYKVISTGYRADCVAHTKTPLIWVSRYNLTKHRYNRTEKWMKEMFVGRRAVLRG
jgi:hypothetical protein